MLSVMLVLLINVVFYVITIYLSLKSYNTDKVAHVEHSYTPLMIPYILTCVPACESGSRFGYIFTGDADHLIVGVRRTRTLHVYSTIDYRYQNTLNIPVADRLLGIGIVSDIVYIITKYSIMCTCVDSAGYSVVDLPYYMTYSYTMSTGALFVCGSGQVTGSYKICKISNGRVIYSHEIGRMCHLYPFHGGVIARTDTRYIMIGQGGSDSLEPLENIPASSLFTCTSMYIWCLSYTIDQVLLRCLYGDEWYTIPIQCLPISIYSVDNACIIIAHTGDIYLHRYMNGHIVSVGNITTPDTRGHITSRLYDVMFLKLFDVQTMVVNDTCFDKNTGGLHCLPLP